MIGYLLVSTSLLTAMIYMIITTINFVTTLITADYIESSIQPAKQVFILVIVLLARLFLISFFLECGSRAFDKVQEKAKKIYLKKK